MSATTIQWTDVSWNPTRGCERVSPGCAQCYAEVQANRFKGPGQPYEGLIKMVGDKPQWTGEVRCVPEKLREPLKWRKPKRVFVNSMSDLFHKDVPDEFIDEVFGIMALCPQHTFQVLTKRPERMRDYLTRQYGPNGYGTEKWCEDAPRALCNLLMAAQRIRRERENNPYLPCYPWPLPNVWLGVSVENQATADERIPLLLKVPAAVRFLSCEPLLEKVSLQKACRNSCPQCRGTGEVVNSEDGGYWMGCPCERLSGLSWVIVGGESGPKARRCELEWIRSIVRQCKETSVPVFVKQLGSSPQCESCLDGKVCWCDDILKRVSDSKGGDPAEWPEDLRVREFP